LELGEDPADVGFHGRFGEYELLGDLRVGVSGGDLDEYLALPRCERCQDLVAGGEQAVLDALLAQPRL
jgi:hypothetical protein